MNYKGDIIDLSTPIVMGILNVNPNSFFDGGKYLNEKSVLDRCESMIEEGVGVIDVGGASSKPGSSLIHSEDELKIVIPVIDSILKRFPRIKLSIDTYNGQTAMKAIEHGVGIVNDISAGEIDASIIDVVAEKQVPYVLMHMKGTPENMQKDVVYKNVKKEILDYFLAKVTLLREKGVKDIVIDPGFGFGKSLENNYDLLNNLDYFRVLDLPILAGLSRKSMISKVLACSSKEALNGTTVLNTIAITKGASILRVHDVKEAIETIKLLNYYTTV